MKSTDQNLNNPTRIDPIEMQRMVDSIKFMNVTMVTQDFYDHIAKPDPHTCYVITDSKEGIMYYGTVKVLMPKNRMRYYISQSTPGEWILFLNSRDGGPFNGDNLIEICRYSDLQTAADALVLYNRVGSHSTMNIEIYNLILQYINGDILLHELILGIMIIFGYKENPNFQNVIQTVYQLDTQYRESGMLSSTDRHRAKFDITSMLKEEIQRIHKNNPTSLLGLFNRIYNKIAVNGFFQGDEYHDDPAYINLTETIDSIVSAFTAWKYMPISTNIV